MTDPMAYENVVDQLIQRVPEFASEVDDHLQSHDEILPHVLLGDLTRFVLQARDEGRVDLVRRILWFLDEAIRRGDEQVENLVSVSFVENVAPWDPEYGSFIEKWPPALRDEAWRQRDWRPRSK